MSFIVKKSYFLLYGYGIGNTWEIQLTENNLEHK